MNEFNALDYIKAQMEYAEEQLMIADDMNSKLVWGNRLDALEDALDYAAISQRVIAVCDESRFQLLEALADHLASIVLAEFSVESLRMTITKPGAVPEAEGVGVVIDRP